MSASKTPELTDFDLVAAVVRQRLIERVQTLRQERQESGGPFRGRRRPLLER